MKTRNRIISFAMLAILLFAMAVPAFAAIGGGITPYYNNTNITESDFAISEDGIATTHFTCRGYRGVTTKIVAETKIEKLVGSSWVQVEGASWTDESTLYYCSKSYSIQLQSTGTYKVTYTFTVSGSGGANDVIVREIERTY